ncbi:MAG TPA: hypothetical protein PK668_12870 [Myxococcota bacterium]|nr:hypothetical protein [Myxococcota bacterium]HRY93637.1 hypothetical protein [Myxococcota bacterium]HSA23343.1 hypothetical protein [Myxococcota bacterium]
MRVLLFFTPWRLAARQAPLSSLRLGLTAWALGLLVLPAFGLGGLLRDLLHPVALEGLPAPQAGLLAAITEGLMETQPAPPWEIALAVLGWLAGGLAAGLLGALLNTLVLLGLSREAPDTRRRTWALGEWGLGYTLVGLPAFICLGQGELAQVLLASALLLTASLGCGALGFGAWRLAGTGRARAAVNATLYGLVIWALAPFVLETAMLLTWLPARLAERLAGG